MFEKDNESDMDREFRRTQKMNRVSEWMLIGMVGFFGLAVMAFTVLILIKSAGGLTCP